MRKSNSQAPLKTLWGVGPAIWVGSFLRWEVGGGRGWTAETQLWAGSIWGSLACGAQEAGRERSSKAGEAHHCTASRAHPPGPLEQPRLLVCPSRVQGWKEVQNEWHPSSTHCCDSPLCFSNPTPSWKFTALFMSFLLMKRWWPGLGDKSGASQSDRVCLNSRSADQLWNLMQTNLLGLSTLISEEKHSKQPHSTSVSTEWANIVCTTITTMCVMCVC